MSKAFMKKILLLSLLLFGCASVQKQTKVTAVVDGITFDVELSYQPVFVNGADRVTLNIKASELLYPYSELTVRTTEEVRISELQEKEGVYQATLEPKINSKSFYVYVKWKEDELPPLYVNTTLSPRATKISARNSTTHSEEINGVDYYRQEHLPVGQYERFAFSNKGKNKIVSRKDSSRNFDFSYREQAMQNISLQVADYPNGNSSHSMNSEFMFFPRKVLPHLIPLESGEKKVILPTGEEMIFSGENEVSGGVFEEGPVDVGPDKSRRTYANLKYQGKGITLRANARGQSPQLGQFESAKIDQEHGVRFSAEVLIINGTTGERCRRPKTDFWSSEDVYPILFKFPTDPELDAHLKAKCGFGIPSL